MRYFLVHRILTKKEKFKKEKVHSYGMVKEQLYKELAKYYDKISSQKNYEKEVDFIDKILRKYKIKGKKILDVACGTGNHAALLKRKGYQVLGIDVSAEMLRIARKKVSGVKFLLRDMKKLNLRKKFDVIICLYNTIHYNNNYNELESTLRSFNEHLKQGGVLIFDLGFYKQALKERFIWIDIFKDKKLQLVRINQSILSGNLLRRDMIFLIKENKKVNFDTDQHILGIFKIKKIKKLMNKIGFKTFIYDKFSLKKFGKESKLPVFLGVKQ